MIWRRTHDEFVKISKLFVKLERINLTAHVSEQRKFLLNMIEYTKQLKRIVEEEENGKRIRKDTNTI